MKNILIWFLGILIVLGALHLISYLLTKGIIWVALELFRINWYDKFWVVYVGVFIVSLIFGGGSSKSK